MEVTALATRPGSNLPSANCLLSSWPESRSLAGEGTLLRQKRRSLVISHADDFDGDEIDFDGDGMDLDDDLRGDDEDDFKDFDVEYELSEGVQSLRARDVHVEAEGPNGDWVQEVVDFEIDEEQFHRIRLHHCDFFIRRFPDPEDNVYDFREMYVRAAGKEEYAYPRILSPMPKKPVRCADSEWKIIVTKEGPLSRPRDPYTVREDEVAKVFLTKHFQNRRAAASTFFLDFEEIYVIDGERFSIGRAPVEVECPTDGHRRNRRGECLLVRSNGTSFKIVPESKRRTPDEVVGEYDWNKTKENMENYLRGFRDFEKSNWF